MTRVVLPSCPCATVEGAMSRRTAERATLGSPTGTPCSTAAYGADARNAPSGAASHSIVYRRPGVSAHGSLREYQSLCSYTRTAGSSSGRSTPCMQVDSEAGQAGTCAWGACLLSTAGGRGVVSERPQRHWAGGVAHDSSRPKIWMRRKEAAVSVGRLIARVAAADAGVNVVLIAAHEERRWGSSGKKSSPAAESAAGSGGGRNIRWAFV